MEPVVYLDRNLWIYGEINFERTPNRGIVFTLGDFHDKFVNSVQDFHAKSFRIFGE